MMKNKGIIPINKPQGWTSFDVVNKLKYKLKPLKVGHLGTLDPMATGVLLITIGKATKLFDIMQEKTKTYIAEFEFGYETDTLDATGEIITKNSYIPTEQEILDVLPKFIGKISQIPPKYSAKSVNGVRAYTLARNGMQFELKPKEVEIYAINMLEFNGISAKLEITCGSGTYIRSIGRDVAKELNTVATMTSLVRTKVGAIDLNKTVEIENLGDLQESILPIKQILDFETLNLTIEEKYKILNGQTLGIEKKDGIYLLEDDCDVIALIKIKENKSKMSVFLG